MKRAFSLVELSIVLVIIGILVAGAVSGNKMLKESKLRKLYKEYQEISGGFVNFQGVYDAYPGDMEEAYNYWGADCGTDAAAPTGCNGNGNKHITWGTERYRALQHLGLAELISGSYTGVNGSGVEPGINIFESGSGLGGNFMPMHTGSGTINNGKRYHGGSDETVLIFGANTSFGATLTPKELYLFDKKYDDGIGYTGSVRIRFDDGISGANSELCDGSNTAYANIDLENDTYDLSNEDIVCTPLFIMEHMI